MALVGSVEILGARLGRVDVRTLRPRIALVSGSVTRQLRADLPARDVVVSGRHGALETWWHTYSDEDWAEADRLLDEAGFAAIADRPFGVISEGERQHVLLARALMSRPELLLLDEPAAGLDLGARERLVSRLGVLAADPAESHHGARHPPLRGDPARLHPRRAGAPGKAGGGRAAGGCRHLVTRLALFRRRRHGRPARRTMVESRRVEIARLSSVEERVAEPWSATTIVELGER